MAPFRASRSTRSGRPGGQSEQEAIEGLPVRQWRLQETFVDTSDDAVAKPDTHPKESTIWKELPMPKGSEHYSPWCHQLLRMARAGRILQTQGSANGSKAEDGDGERDEGADATQPAAAKSAKTGMKRGFGATRWAQVTKSAEEPEREFLAKRRKGLPPMYGAGGIAGPGGNATPMRKTKVRKVNAAGHAYVWEVLVPEGQTVEGEIKDEAVLETVVAQVSAPPPGTIVEGLGVANEEGVVIAQDSATAPIKRKGPPPRRKPKRGPGRGKKKITFAEGDSTSAERVSGALQGGETGAVNGESVSRQESEDKANEHHEGDEEDYEDGEDDEDGEEGEEDDREEGELSPSPQPETQDASMLTSTFNESTGQIDEDTLADTADAKVNGELEPLSEPIQMPTEIAPPLSLPVEPREEIPEELSPPPPVPQPAVPEPDIAGEAEAKIELEAQHPTVLVPAEPNAHPSESEATAIVDESREPPEQITTEATGSTEHLGGDVQMEDAKPDDAVEVPEPPAAETAQHTLEPATES